MSRLYYIRSELPFKVLIMEAPSMPRRMFYSTLIPASAGQSPPLLAGAGIEGRGLLAPEVSSLYEQLGNTPDFPPRAQTLDRFFPRRLDRCPPLHPHGRALQFPMSSGAGIEVAEAARHAEISQRQLERRSLDLAGVALRRSLESLVSSGL